MKIVAVLSIAFLFFVSTTNGQVFDMFDTTEDVVDTPRATRVKKDYEYNPRYNRRLRSPNFHVFDNAFNTFDEEDDGWQCDTPLPTSLTRKVFAYESILAKPFCGRPVYMDKNDKLLKEGPKICPYSASSCEGHEVLKRLKILRQNVKGSIYYNCYANVCFRFPDGRRLRRMLRRRLQTPAYH